MELVIVRHTIIVYYTIGIPSYSPHQKYCPINYIILYAGYRYARVGNLAVHRGVRTIYWVPTIPPQPLSFSYPDPSSPRITKLHLTSSHCPGWCLKCCLIASSHTAQTRRLAT